jgi:hypothetical protein
LNPETGFVSTPWYLFLLSLSQLTGGSDVSLGDLQKGPPTLTVDEINALIDKASAALDPSQDGLLAQLAELQKQVNGLEMQVRPELGTMSQLQQDNVPWLQFDTAPEGYPTGPFANGTLYWDDADAIKTLNIVMEDSGEVIQHIGEETYYRVKASAAITEGQVVMFTGTVGASGGLRGAPATGLTAFQGEYIMGVATQDIANNGWGYVTWFGEVKGVNTTGGAEVWVDGQILYYDPAVAGGLTKNVPTAPNPKVIVASVVHAASNGILFVRPTFGSALGATDSNVEITGLANGDILQYDLVQQRWENVPSSTLPVGTATNLAGGAAGSVPYQSAPSTTTFRAIGTAGQVFRVNSGATAPEWVSAAALTKTDDTNVTLTLGGNPTTALLAAASLTLGWTGQLAATRGGTGFDSYAVGDLLYADTTTTLAKLADVATGNALISGGVGVAPSWGKIGLTTHVSGTLPVANGGTGITSFGTGVATWLGTPSSANLAAAVTDETGSGSLVFATRPSFASTIGVGGATASASGAGVSFPAAQSASTDPNTFDDYEEGTWTPGYAPTTGAFTTITYGFASGYYRKIGDIVFCTCRLRTSAFVVGTGSGIVLLTGLPFTTFSATASNAATPAAISVSWVVNPSGIVTVASSTTAQIQKTFSNTGTVVADMSAGAANNFLSLTFFYVAA